MKKRKDKKKKRKAEINGQTEQRDNLNQDESQVHWSKNLSKNKIFTHYYTASQSHIFSKKLRVFESFDFSVYKSCLLPRAVWKVVI